MSDFKWEMQQRVDAGMSPDAAYEATRDSYADAADLQRKRRKEFHCNPDESGGVDENWPDTEGPTGIAGFRSGRYR